MFRALSTALVAATVTLMSSACGGSDPAPGQPGGPGTPVDTSKDAAALCAEACENAQSGLCENTNPDCAADCTAAFEEFPDSCLDEAKAVFACYAQHTVVCDGESAPAFPGCTSALVALGTCMQAQADHEPDPSYGGRCLPTSSTPENSETYCGALSDTPLLYECTGGAPRTGCVAEPTGADDLYCCPEL